ncbi:ferredoxin-NADP reductase [Actinomadura hallensis]|uniref:Ferredoxin-NADP reductase n=1 Tax=Actinomadura hallensis TaxID=337895 RepID=A0A543IGL1_9ACTN|nr:PDR/VanB family oxidoreductase [Actinomadura hallensis]TQM69721.1 ferredoxin-NADP reductase [Actinomadura hallensis]HLU28253.1 PDR/VanB family oxidoreductase [Glycomyces sp.]
MVMTEDVAARAAVAGDGGDDVRMTVAAKELLTSDIVQLTLVADREVPEWEPGAHIDLVLGDGLVRQYSLCGDPADRGRLQVAVLREPGGRGGSRHVHDVLAVGDEVGVRGPRNNFPLEPAPGYLFVAGGVGITPLVPMIEAVHARGVPWRLLYGGRTRSSMAFADRLTELDPAAVQLRPQDEFGLLDLDSALDAVPADTAVYCCGPEPLLRAMEQAVAERPPLRLRLERFTPVEPDPDAVDTAFEVELHRSGRVIQVAADATLLDALTEAGVDIDFSCREGTCGTCETDVLDGVPDHRDSLLTDEEKAANDVMFPCVSRCLSRRLVLDL